MRFNLPRNQNKSVSNVCNHMNLEHDIKQCLVLVNPIVQHVLK